MKFDLKNLIREFIQEIELDEDYPASFDMETFKSLRSHAGRNRYAEEHLQKLAAGSSRIVYKIDDEKVLKLAKNDKGIAQNGTEISWGNDSYFGDILAKIFDYDDSDLWVEMELARKVTKSEFKKLTGFDISDVDAFLKNWKEEMRGKRGFFRIDPELNDRMGESEFIQSIQDFSHSANIEIGDFGRVSSYGIVKRNGHDVLVITDYGLTKDVYATHYDKPRKIAFYEGENLNESFENETMTVYRIGEIPYDEKSFFVAPDWKHWVKFYPNEPIYKIITNKLYLPLTNKSFNSFDELKRKADSGEFSENDLSYIYPEESGIQHFEQYEIRPEDILGEPELIKKTKTDLKENETLEEIERRDTWKKEIAQVAKKLNVPLTNYLGSGVWGIAYEIPGNRVLKITEDEREVEAAKHLVGKKNKLLVDIYKIYSVKGSKDKKVIIMEKLAPLGAYKKIIEKFNKAFDEFYNPDYTWAEMVSVGYDEDFDDTLSPQLSSVYRDIFDVFYEAQEKGVYLTDMHMENMGLKNGQLAAFDLS